MHQPRPLNCISQALSDDTEVPQLHQPRFLDCISQADSDKAEVPQLHQPSAFGHIISTLLKPQSSPVSTSTNETNSFIFPNVISDVLSRLPFTNAKYVKKSSALDDAPREVNSPESEIPRPFPLEDSSSAILISNATSECDESDESLSDSDDLNSKCDFESLECETDSKL